MIAVAVLNNCKDPIALKSKPEGGVLVVNGKVSTKGGPFTVGLGYTSPDGRKPIPAPGASISLINNQGDRWSYIETQPGEYTLPENTVTILPGDTYHVEIELSDGSRYYSEDETVPMATGTTASRVEFERKQVIENNTEITRDVVNVFTDSQLPASEGPQFFKWDVDEVYMFEQTPVPDPLLGGRLPQPCYVTGYADPQRITLFSTENLNIDHIENKLVAVRAIDQSFLARHYFIVNMSSISRQAYTYWDRVNSLVNRSGSIFDTPPAPIVGNIHNVNDDTEKVFGYFEATNTSFKRIFVLRGDIPFAVAFYCYEPAKGIYYEHYPDECYQCTLLPNSSHDKPDWF